MVSLRLLEAQLNILCHKVPDVVESNSTYSLSVQTSNAKVLTSMCVRILHARRTPYLKRLSSSHTESGFKTTPYSGSAARSNNATKSTQIMFSRHLNHISCFLSNWNLCLSSVPICFRRRRSHSPSFKSTSSDAVSPIDQ